MPFVSVIIPNYNHADFLKERIESVLNQTYLNFELIILDDCSTDNSRDLIEKYREHPKVSHIQFNTSNSGSLFRQWHIGLQLAKGEWIWIAESDDIAYPSFLETLVRCIQQHPSAGIVYSNSYKMETDVSGFKSTAEETNFNFSTDNWNHNHWIKGEDAIRNYLSKKNIILNASSALIKKQYLDSVLPEAKNMKYYADWYVYILISARAGIGYSNQPLNTFRRHPQSLIRKAGSMGIKTDCFRILNLLLKQPLINSKTELIKYFAGNYIKPGLKKEGKIFFVKLLAGFFFINPKLAVVVVKNIFSKN